MSSSRKFTLSELLANPSFRRWAEGSATENEKQSWDSWIRLNPANRHLARIAQEEITGFIIEPSDEPSTSQAYLRLEEEIERATSDFRLTGVPDSLRRPGSARIWAFRAAAAVLLILTSGYLIRHYHYTAAESAAVTETIHTEVSTGFGEQKRIRLTDGSEIILNGNSRIVYTAAPGNPTAVDLHLEGEAWFSVSPRVNPGDRPFQARTDDGLIRVLGTKLVISTRNNQTRVVLQDGRLAVHPNRMDRETLVLPGQLVEFTSQSDTVVAEFVNTELHTSWINGRLYFEQSTLAEVLERLEHTYGVTTVISDSLEFGEKISGSIESSNLETIVSALAHMLDLGIRLSEDEKVIFIGPAE